LAPEQAVCGKIGASEENRVDDDPFDEIGASDLPLAARLMAVLLTLVVLLLAGALVG
jgi:hypothetical protein